MNVLGVLVPIEPSAPLEEPGTWPLGQAGLLLAAEGVELLMGDRVDRGWMQGLVPTSTGWRSARARPIAFYDRYPSQGRAEPFRLVLDNLDGRPLGNPWPFTRLCRDKLHCQRTLEELGLVMPAVEDRPERFARRLREWGHGFLKPRYGSLGAGVRLVGPGDPLPTQLPGAQGSLEPAILQQAVPPPAGLAGRCVRVLAQRAPDGSWVQAPGALRQSQLDPVVNAERGARVLAVQDALAPPALARLQQRVADTLAAIDRLPVDHRALEVGIDLVLDDHDAPHLIELNGRPRGRLERLAQDSPDRFQDARMQTLLRPLRTLLAWGLAAS